MKEIFLKGAVSQLSCSVPRQRIKYLHTWHNPASCETNIILCLPSIISNVTNKNELWRTVSVTSLKNHNSSIRSYFGICCIILPSCNVFSGYFKGFQFCGSSLRLNFDNFRDTAPLTNFLFQVVLKCKWKTPPRK